MDAVAEKRHWHCEVPYLLVSADACTCVAVQVLSKRAEEARVSDEVIQTLQRQLAAAQSKKSSVDSHTKRMRDENQNLMSINNRLRLQVSANAAPMKEVVARNMHVHLAVCLATPLGMPAVCGCFPPSSWSNEGKT